MPLLLRHVATLVVLLVSGCSLDRPVRTVQLRAVDSTSRHPLPILDVAHGGTEGVDVGLFPTRYSYFGDLFTRSPVKRVLLGSGVGVVSVEIKDNRHTYDAWFKVKGYEDAVVRIDPTDSGSVRVISPGSLRDRTSFDIAGYLAPSNQVVDVPMAKVGANGKPPSMQ